MPLKSRRKPSNISPAAPPMTRPAAPDRLRPARGIALGLTLGALGWGVIIAGVLLLR
ncbi:hypothetical protein [Novacetimonas pomaceti]|uniref:hypothetical protein n=1 Tax=Novacetimonas pomaceti TaxID=2021998 RepID=UPI001C2D8801|nr:hypothetical protein [Novacetimonas pomaceti]MBV1833307.1 hypothetical protein [Novacetimonas pomaceti]